VKYLCLVYRDESNAHSIPLGDENAIVRETLDLFRDLRDAGQLVTAARLQPVQSATTINVRDGQTFITDGPYAETKEQLGGFLLIEARDLNEAIRIAAKLPQARIGKVEVRPILHIAA
jgi:hypothetical protein